MDEVKDMGNLLEVKNLGKEYEKGKSVLSDISFDLNKASITAVIGNSGGGKSTLLKLIAGYEFPSSGQILKNGNLISEPNSCTPPQKRKIGMIFQDYALFPHLTVDQNIRFGHQANSKNSIDINSLYELTRLSDFKTRYPRELSGGEQQRVAIARSMAAQPDILLMDEPFSSIDVVNREKVRSELKSMLEAAKMSTIMVSHDYKDAMALADQVLILKDGNCVQKGSPLGIYNEPNDIFVARLFGECNEIKGKWVEEIFECAFGKLHLPQSKTQQITLFIRPRTIKVEY